MTKEIPHTRVGIAIIEHEGHFLIGQRTESQVLGGYDEFPGGKCFPEESFEACAIRECREETGVEVQVVNQFHATRHIYEHGEIEIVFMKCQPLAMVNLQESCNGFKWIPRSDLATLRFPEANAIVVRKLIETPDDQSGT